MQIGLMIYKVQVWENYRHLELGRQPDQFDLYSNLATIFDHYERNPYETPERRIRFTQEPPRALDYPFQSGFISYSSRGLASQFEHALTGEQIFERNREDWESIPIYFALYCPDGSNAAYVAVQSFGNRSCVSLFCTGILDFFRDRWVERNITFEKVLALDQNVMANRAVKNIRLVQRFAEPGMLQPQVGVADQPLRVELSISPEGRGNFGRLIDVINRFEDQPQHALLVGGMQFDQVDATIRIGDKYRRVGVVGMADRAGNVDISDDVERDEQTLYPLFLSIDALARELLVNYGQEFGL